MDADARLDEMRPHRAFGDLELERPVGDAIVIADLALLLHAQDLVEVDAGDGREGRAFAGRQNREMGVMGRKIDPADEGVGRLDCGDSGEFELLRQPVLKRLERAFRSASRLRRESADVLDPKLAQRPSTWVGQPRSISPAFAVWK
jgi:hypothetical protein